jgi:DNA-binding response OmpR family regulator
MIGKPFSFDELTSRVRALLDDGARRAPSPTAPRRVP